MSMRNLWRRLRGVLPDAPLLAGTVSVVEAGIVTVALPGAGLVRARTSLTLSVGQRVFVRDGVVEGIAPSLQVVEIEI